MLQSSPPERQLASSMVYMLFIYANFLGIFEPLSVMNQKTKKFGFQGTCALCSVSYRFYSNEAFEGDAKTWVMGQGMWFCTVAAWLCHAGASKSSCTQADFYRVISMALLLSQCFTLQRTHWQEISDSNAWSYLDCSFVSNF